MAEFDGKVVLITGAGGGIGSVTAKFFADEGAKLVLVDFFEDRILDVKKDLALGDDRCITVKADVTKENEVENYVKEAEKAFGKIDVFFNNAGLLRTGEVKDSDIEEVKKCWDVNIVGAFMGLKHVIRSMEKSGGGSIICTGSIDSFGADPGNAIYAASKYAVMGMSKCAALEAAKYGIRINVICPGAINIGMMRQYAKEMFEGESWVDDYNKKIPMGRMGRPEDIAKGVLFLASDRSSYMTGTRLVIDGGYKHE